MLYLVFFLSVLVPFYALGQQCTVCPDSFTYYPLENKCYRGFPSKQTWENAKSMCHNVNSHLLVLKDATGNTALNQHIQSMKKSCISDVTKKPTFWTAGKRDCPGVNVFSWFPGKGGKMDITYLPWQTGEPHNLLNIEDCIHLVSEDDGELNINDIFCEMGNCVICEIDM